MRRRDVVAAASLAALLLLPAARARAALQRTIDDGDAVVLRGNVSPLASPEADVGLAYALMPMERMILTLRIADDKRAALDRLLADQQDPASPEYHRWLTPEEFGARFGPSPDELAAITDWLVAQGFVVDEVAKGRTWIDFSGVVADVERAFHTEIHEFFVDGELHHANASDPAIPRALAGLVAGVVSLHDFPRLPLHRDVRPLGEAGLRPDYTNGSGLHFLSPTDFATIYNLAPLYAAGIDGSGQTLAIVARTHPPASDWSTFRSTMALPSNVPQVILNGTDPGSVSIDEDTEADLDAEWSGAVAVNATVDFVVSKSTMTTDGVDLSAQYIVNNNLAPVMSTSFGQCEHTLGTAGNTFYNNLWSQAAAQGITSFVSTGDAGAAGCNGGSDSSGSGGLAVSGLASTPYNVAVGGTEFNEGAGSYWTAANGTGDASAKSYIPEIAWNESGAAPSCPTGDSCTGLWSSGGGKSTKYSKPAWQVCTGVPADGVRDIPDVSLNAALYDGYLVVVHGGLGAVGGTSASSPSFAGLMALVVQRTGLRQGNANVRLYQLASAQYASGGTAIFHDITSGNNTVPGLAGYSCTTAYDLVTGLGSVDATALVNNFASVPASFAIGAAPTSVSAAQGGSGTSTISTTIAGGFNSAISLAASGLPSGVTAGFSPASIAAPGAGASTLTLSASAAALTGIYPVTVTGTGGGASHAVTLTLTVTAGPAPGFAVGLAPPAVSAQQGGSSTVTVTTSVVGGFSHAVSLAAGGLPAGATAAFNPTTISAPGAGSSALSLTAGAATPTGVYAVTVTATGGGATHSATVSWTVIASSSGGGLTNGTFETGSLSGWTSTGTTAATGTAAHSGAWGARVGGTSATNGDSSIAQTFTLPAGGPQITFWYSNHCPDTVTYDWATATLKDNSTSVTATLLPKTCTPVPRWTQVSFDATASAGHSVTLTLTSHDDNYAGDPTYTWFDDVAVLTPGAFSIGGTITQSGSGLSGVTVTAGAASATTNASGVYTLSGLVNGTYIVIPSLAAHVFTPASQTVSVNGANLTGVNFTASAGGGATTLFSDGFEGGGWASAQVAGASGAWKLVTSGKRPSAPPHGGARFADFNSYTAPYGNQARLYRPSGFAISSSFTTVTLTFWVYHDTGYPASADTVQAQVSTNGGSTWTSVGSAVPRSNGSTGWAQVSVPISTYKGNTVLLGFLGTSAYGNDCYLDDVVVTGQ